MATMIPPDCEFCDNPAEKTVFELLKKTFSADWYVFYSLNYLERSYEGKTLEGEIDFILYHPVKGILVLEVKGGTISHTNGVWYQNGCCMNPAPDKQAVRNKNNLMKRLADRLGKGIPLKFAYALCFPVCNRQPYWPQGADGVVISKDDLPHIDKFVDQILEDAYIPPEFVGKTIAAKEILQALSPTIGNIQADRLKADEEQILLLTEQQSRQLNLLKHFKRLQVIGCAGSGKTVIAQKRARQLAEQGKRVLLLCYNKLLANSLQETTREVSNIETAAFYDFCITLMKISAAEMNQPDAYKELPSRLMTYLDQHPLTYDAIIVDEGQDFTADSWDVIEMMLASGGHFHIFYDPDQNIFQKELKLPDFGHPPVVLEHNCRNTKKIFEAMKPYRTLEATSMESAPVGVEVRDLTGFVPQLLAKELGRLLTVEKIPAGDIVILGARSLKNTSIADLPKVSGVTVVENPEAPAKQQIAYHTYMKFKGCEAKVVILVDVDESHTNWRRSGLYTAMSRAMHQLIILRPKQ